MRKELLITALGLCLTAVPAAADVLAVPETAPAPTVGLPGKGTSMADVEKRYGSPREKRPTVGGGSPKQPPITRWDYDGFLVIFEHDKVIDAVVPGAPAPVFNKSELEPVAGAPPMPGARPEAPAAAPDSPDAMPDQPAPSAAPAEPEAPAETMSPTVRETPAEPAPTPR